MRKGAERIRSKPNVKHRFTEGNQMLKLVLKQVRRSYNTDKHTISQRHHVANGGEFSY